VLEKAYPWIEPANDPALKRLRKYGLQAEWSWSTERAMARDLAELVEDMEASRQLGQGLPLQYRAVLVRLVADKLDMDRGDAILEYFENTDLHNREALFKQSREATVSGWNRGINRVKAELETLRGDPLAYYKGYANCELGKDRFVRPAASNGG
jgi:hypothetical protein